MKKDNWSNDEDYNFEDPNFEMDEIAKMYALEDMKKESQKWLREQVNIFYKDFEGLSIEQSIEAVNALILTNQFTKNSVITLFNNVISIFQEDEEYEKCYICLEIKKGIDARI